MTCPTIHKTAQWLKICRSRSSTTAQDLKIKIKQNGSRSVDQDQVQQLKICRSGASTMAVCIHSSGSGAVVGTGSLLRFQCLYFFFFKWQGH